MNDALIPSFAMVHLKRSAIFLIYKRGIDAKLNIDLIKSLYPNAYLETYENTMTAIVIPQYDPPCDT